MVEKEEKQKNYYPHFVLANNEHPRLLYSFPFFGFLLKIIMLIPVIVGLAFLGIASCFLWVINSFYILFTGTYWDTAYTFFLNVMRYQTKTSLFLFGLSDRYPGFNFDTNGLFELNIPKPSRPSKLLASPFLGIIIRVVLLIPYFIFSSVLRNGTNIAVFLSWFAVLFNKKYPESFYEFARDYIRVDNAQSSYLMSLSDTYPSFYISMNHQTAKVLLIIGGAILSMAGGGSNSDQKPTSPNDYQTNYSNQQQRNAYPPHRWNSR